LCVVDADTWVTTDGVWGPAGKSILLSDDAVFLIPQAPLVNGGYTVTVSQPGRDDVVWSFAVAAGLSSAVAPVVAGKAAVGSYVSVTGGSWALGVKPVAAGVAYRFQWSVNGVPVPGAAGQVYYPVAADVGKALSVSVTAAMAGYTAGSVTVAAGTVAPAAVVNTVAPRITGTARVGVKLTASGGAWSAGGAKVALAYRWYAGGVAVAGATGASFTPGAGQAGKRLTVTVTATAPGWAAGAKSSGQTAVVAKGTLGLKVKPKLSGTVRAGATLKAGKGTWSPAATVKFQWYAGGKAVKGATKASLKLTAAMRGKKITVKVTAARAGYTTRTITLKTSTAVR